MCGEKSNSVSGLKKKSGSPPRVRGKAIAGFSMELAKGITPACAGKRFSVSEKYPLIKGSPPRVRGKDQYKKNQTVL